MREVYLINDSVLFDTELNVLIDKENKTIKVPLNRPISRCLQLLIERKDEIVSQEDFFEYVWRAHGSKITANTYYQNISILRRALSQIGLGNEMIKTVSRKGLMLSQPIDIICVPLPENEAKEAEQEPLSDISRKLKNKSGSGDNPLYKNILKLPPVVKNNKLFLIFFSFFIILLFTLLFFHRVILPGSDPASVNYFLEHQYIGKAGACHVYSNRPYELSETFLSERKAIGCNTTKHAYLTWHDFYPDVSLLVCQDKVNGKSFSLCTSFYYIGGI